MANRLRFTLLGIKYDLNQNDFTYLNYESKLKEIEKELSLLNYRKLTMYGKICIIKSLALPKLVHLFFSLPDPPADFFKKLQKICFSFIWNGKIEKIKRTTLYNDYGNGGLKLPHFQSFCRAQKLIWVKKLLDDTNWSEWKTFFIRY
jgi:hypothetical protein